MTDMSHLWVIIVASQAASDDEVAVENSLVVAHPSQQADDIRVYWKGKRVVEATVSGSIDHSKQNPDVSLVIDGQPVALTLREPRIRFKDRTLTVYGGYARVDYDAEADTIY